ncbi:MAG TPA: hypothetical protein VJ964_17650 [Balneolaceae bacterium]|nr:hypothetical protein [Balneolaceae bacterium]
MKKPLTFYGLLFLLLGITLQSKAQSEISVNTGGNERPKTVSEGRTLALSNTIMPLGVGMGTVAFVNNNTVRSIGAAMAVYGIVAGASTGNFYANDYARGGLGMAVRLVGAYLMKNATSEIFGHRFANALNIDNKDVSLGDTKILIGAGLVVGSMIYNFMSVNKSVQEYNNSKKRFTLNVSPAAVSNKVSPLLTARLNF